jgi:hypothetical protein
MAKHDDPNQPPPDQPKGKEARKIQHEAEHKARQAARAAEAARLKDIPPGTPVVTNPPSPVTHDPFAEEDDSVGEP